MHAWRFQVRLWDCRLESRLASRFLVTVASIWSLAAFMKLSTLASGWHYLELADPLFRVSTAWLFALVASVELLTAGYLLFSPNSLRRFAVCTGVIAAFWIYRLGIEFVSSRPACGCFGKGLSWIGVSQDASDQVAFVALAYCTIGVVFIWFAELDQRTKGQQSDALTHRRDA
jgi:hypothetical protein